MLKNLVRFSIFLLMLVVLDTLQAHIDIPIIDAHIHTRFSQTTHNNLKDLLMEMKDLNVVNAISLGDSLQESTTGLESHGIVHCVGIGNTFSKTVVEKNLKSKKFRCIKIYLGYIYRFANDRYYHPLYHLAEKYDVPVIFHTGDTYSIDGKLKYSHPLTIDEVAVDFRNVRFVIAHLGNPWIQTAAEVAYKNPNVYVDGSALMIGDFDKINSETINQYVTQPIRWAFHYMENPNKLLYATDWPLVKMNHYLNAFKKAIPRKHWKDVFHNNAVKVFKLNRELIK